METIRGKQSREMDRASLIQRLGGRREVLIDISTGDGRFVRHMAQARPERFVIGVDICRENLNRSSRDASPNVLYVIADAQALPTELHGLATSITINFPWGSLLAGLLSGNPSLFESLRAVAQPQAGIEVRLNAGGLAEAGWSFEDGLARAQWMLRAGGFETSHPVLLDAQTLRSIPTTWAKRLAFGRDPRGLCLPGRRTRLGKQLQIRQWDQ